MVKFESGGQEKSEGKNKREVEIVRLSVEDRQERERMREVEGVRLREGDSHRE